ncbi:MAG: DUF1573 domain-containing protein [Planctomycetota bacterium]|jgi:hypothetical protein
MRQHLNRRRVTPGIRLVAGLMLLAISGPTGMASTWAHKMFANTHHDFGTVSRNAKTEYAFVLENCYEEDVHIAGVRSSCGCTTPVVTKSTLKSWEKGEILAKFNTRTFLGTKSAMITVIIDRPYYAEVQLTVGGTIRSDISVDPGEIRFGETEVGADKTVDLRIAYTGPKNWKIVDVRGNSDALEVRLDSPTRQPNYVVYNMRVKLKPTTVPGDFQEELVVVTNDENETESQFTLPISARILPPVTVTPDKILLGDIKKGEFKQQRLVVKAKKPFGISKIDCEDKRFEFQIPSEEKTVHVLQFTFRGEYDTPEGRSVHQKVLIETTTGEIVETVVTGRVLE